MNKKYLLVTSFVFGMVSLVFAGLFVIKVISSALYKAHYAVELYALDFVLMLVFSIVGLILHKRWREVNNKNCLSCLSFVLNILGLLPAAVFVLVIVFIAVSTPFFLLYKH